MKKIQLKRVAIGSAKALRDLKKPFEFCCDIDNQDPETQYDMRIPPFETSLTNITPHEDGPDLKFRIQDIGRPTHPTLRSGTHKVKSSVNLGRCKLCRGPLRWYIEEEVALARDIVAKERRTKFKQNRKAEPPVTSARRNRTKVLTCIKLPKEKDPNEEEGPTKCRTKRTN